MPWQIDGKSMAYPEPSTQYPVLTYVLRWSFKGCGYVQIQSLLSRRACDSDDWAWSRTMIPTEIDRWAGAINQLRPDWPCASLRTFAATNLADRAYRDALVAGVWVAADPDTRTPARVLEAGPWWAACTPPTERKPTEPGLVTRCVHEIPGTRCPDCFPPRKPRPCPPDVMATIRAAIAAAKPTPEQDPENLTQETP